MLKYIVLGMSYSYKDWTVKEYLTENIMIKLIMIVIFLLIIALNNVSSYKMLNDGFEKL